MPHGNDAIVIFNGHADRTVFAEHQVVQPATIPGLRERTITIGCVSKNYDMPGWRIGWAAAPQEIAHALEDTHIFNGIMPSGFAQAGAIAALSGSQDWQHQLVATFERNQHALLKELADAPGVEPVPAEGGYYLLADVSGTGLDAETFCTRALDEVNVALTPMRGWGSDDFGTYQVRLIFTNEPEQRIREAGRRLVAFARGLDS